MSSNVHIKAQGGVILIAAMVILLVIALLVTTMFESNLMQQQMAGNARKKAHAQQAAMTVVDALLERRDHFSLRAAPGQRRCSQDDGAGHCVGTALVIDEQYLPEAGALRFSIERKGPWEIGLPVMSEDKASSGRHFRAALFDVQVSFVGGHVDSASVTVHQGVLIRRASANN